MRFNQTEFERWIYAQGKWNENTSIFATDQDFVDFLAGNIKQEEFPLKNARTCELIRKIFKDFLAQEPTKTTIPYRIYFLFRYGYQVCSSCHVIRPIEQFHNLQERWTGKGHHCKLCNQNKSMPGYYLKERENNEK